MTDETAPEPTFEDYTEKVTILCVPEGEHEHHAKGGIAIDTARFWLHTVGMAEFGCPELEMRDVPALAVSQVHRMLNQWAYYTVAVKPIQDGENIRDDSGPFPIIITAEESCDEWYAKRQLSCIRLVPRVVLQTCQHPDHNHDDGDFADDSAFDDEDFLADDEDSPDERLLH